MKLFFNLNQILIMFLIIENSLILFKVIVFFGNISYFQNIIINYYNKIKAGLQYYFYIKYIFIYYLLFIIYY